MAALFGLWLLLLLGPLLGCAWDWLLARLSGAAPLALDRPALLRWSLSGALLLATVRAI